MADGKKGGLAVLIGMGGKPKADEGGDDPKSLAMKSLMKAFAANDVAGALDAYDLLCDSKSEASTEPAEDDAY